MKRDDDEGEAFANIARGVRLDLVIAVCALLISTLATGASWWQARVMQAQTQVLQQQLGAQVWPYVNINEGVDGDTVKVSITNDGLGPAILRSESVTVDGAPKSNFIDVMHAILGRNIVARVPHGQRISLALDGNSPGDVLRPGDTTVYLALTSKHYARPFLRAYRRLRFRTCYCAIVPGTCWVSDTGRSGDPQPVQSCRELPNDLLHSAVVEELLNSKF